MLKNSKQLRTFMSIFILLLILISLPGCHRGEYNDVVKRERKEVSAMVVANYCTEGEIRNIYVGRVFVQRYYPPEYTTIIQYDYGNGYEYLELEIHDKALYESVEICDYVNCFLITETLENGKCTYLEFIYRDKY